MHAAARQQAILQHLARRGQAAVGELALALAVSDDTIRRDLARLAARGLLRKAHGGAVLPDVPALPRSARDQLLPALKHALGVAVAAHIPAGASLMLDAGSTTLEVARALQGEHLVITHSLDIAVALADRPGIRLVLAGDRWDPLQRLFAGPAAVDTVRRYRADLAILGACAVHPQLGLTASDPGDAEIKRAMLAGSESRWLVTDHLKYDRCAPHAVAPLETFVRLYCDRPLVAKVPTHGPWPQQIVISTEDPTPP
jgi:DeoR family glycerol-3-phosphate regulon repressor